MLGSNSSGITEFTNPRFQIGKEIKSVNAFVIYTGLDVSSEAAGVALFYKTVTLQNRVFTDKHYLTPIPQVKIDKDPNLIQNYGRFIRNKALQINLPPLYRKKFITFN